MQLRQDREIYENYVLRLGELHAAFAMLKVIGKYIESSGLESPFFESRTYGETTLKQILQGKHMKYGLEANIIHAPSHDTDFLQGVADLKRKIQGCDK